MKKLPIGAAILPIRGIQLKLGDAIEFTAGPNGGNELLEMTLEGRKFGFPGHFILEQGKRYRVELRKEALMVGEIESEEFTVIPDEGVPPTEDIV